MTRQKKNPLRPLSEQELNMLKQLSRASSAPAVQVERAKLILAVSQGMDYTQAARSLGRKSNDAVSHLVQRFNSEGLAALTPRHEGEHPTSPVERLYTLQKSKSTSILRWVTQK